MNAWDTSKVAVSTIKAPVAAGDCTEAPLNVAFNTEVEVLYVPLAIAADTLTGTVITHDPPATAVPPVKTKNVVPDSVPPQALIVEPSDATPDPTELRL